MKVLTASNVSAKVRMEAGKTQGWRDAAAIMANLSEGESIKLVTHSMGTAYARGYAEGLMQYASVFDIQHKVKIDYELDVNAFQGKSLAASGLVKRTQYKLGGQDGGKNLTEMASGNSVPTVAAVPNAENATMDQDADKGHAVNQMSSDNIPQVGNAGTSTQKPVEQGCNNNYGNKRLTFLLMFLFLTSCLQSCGQSKNSNKIEIYRQYRMQALEYRDSLFIFYTAQQWDDSNFDVFENLSKMYRMTNDVIIYFNGGVFYSVDKRKIIVWEGERTPNAATINKYSTDSMTNRRCPNSGEIVYNLRVIIGFREDTNDIWKLYPLDNQLVGCGRSQERAINIMGQYYFEKMKDHSEFVNKNFLDKNYGGDVRYDLQQNNTPLENALPLIGKNYGYNLQDKDFWTKSLIWQKGARVPGLYDFQTTGNVLPDDKDAERKPPKIVYPAYILKLYNRGS